EVLGQYSIAAQLADAIGILPASAALVLFPRLARDPSNSWPLAIRTCGRVGLLLALVAGLTGILADSIVGVTYGRLFSESATQFRLLLPGVVFLGMLAVMSQFVAAVGFPVSIVAAWS